MYWQKRLDRKNPDQEIEAEMLKIREKHKDYGCLRMTNELRNRGFSINKKESSAPDQEARNKSNGIHT